MNEFLQIIFFSLVFTSLLFLPFNIFSKISFSNGVDIIEKTSLNFFINLNILLFLSFLPFSVQTIQPIVVTIYLVVLIYSYRNNLVLILRYLKSFFPVLIIFCLLAVHISSEMYLGWDAKYFYYIKSLFFYEGKTIFDLNQFEYSVWHPHYGSYLWGFFWNLSFVDIEYFGRLFYLFLFCYSLFVISKISKKDLINDIIFLLLIFLSYEYKFFSGLQEVLIFSFLAILSKNFFLISKKNDKSYSFFLLSIFLISNLLIWIKSEGIVFFLILLLLIVLQSQIPIKKRFIFFGLFLAFYFLKLTVYEITDLNNGQRIFYNLEYILSLNFEIIFHKLFNILIWFFYYLSNNIFFAFFVFLMIYERLFLKKSFKINHRYNRILMIYLCFILIFIIFAYVLRDMEIEYAIRTTMDRLLMTISGFFIYPTLKILKNNLFKFSS